MGDSPVSIGNDARQVQNGYGTTIENDSDYFLQENPYPISTFHQLFDAERQGHYCKGYIDGVENLEKFENDLRMETNQKFSTIVSHCRASHSIAKKQRYSEEVHVFYKQPFVDGNGHKR